MARRGRSSDSSQPFAWVEERPTNSFIINRFGALPTQTLFQVPSGAILQWTFDLDPGTFGHSDLIVHLTNEEVERLLARDVATDGVLETVRDDMETRDGAVIAYDDAGDIIDIVGIYVPDTAVPEEVFVDLLFAASEGQETLDEWVAHELNMLTTVAYRRSTDVSPVTGNLKGHTGIFTPDIPQQSSPAPRKVPVA